MGKNFVPTNQQVSEAFEIAGDSHRVREIIQRALEDDPVISAHPNSQEVLTTQTPAGLFQ